MLFRPSATPKYSGSPAKAAQSGENRGVVTIISTGLAFRQRQTGRLPAERNLRTGRRDGSVRSERPQNNRGQIQHGDSSGEHAQSAAKRGGMSRLTDDAPQELDPSCHRWMQPLAEPAFATAAAERQQRTTKIVRSTRIDVSLFSDGCVEVRIVLQEPRIPTDDNYSVCQHAERNAEAGCELRSNAKVPNYRFHRGFDARPRLLDRQPPCDRQ